MKKWIGMTALALLTMVNSISAAPIESVTSEMIQIPEGYVLTKEGKSTINILNNVSVSYLPTDALKTDSIAVHELASATTGAISTILAEEAIVREKPTPDSDIVNFIKKDIPVFVSERIDNFYKIEIQGIEGYIYKEQLDEETLSEVPYTRSEANQKPVEKPVEQPKYLGEQIVDYAKQFLGNPYVYGGNSLTKGADCSGFTQQVMKHFGIQLQRSSRSQYASNGYKVSQDQLLPGDLVFYGYNGYIDHVAIYAGNGQIIHASTPKTGICMSKLNYGKPIIGIKRVIQ